jgi:CRP/FNR family cyclic AMP-dependent transcriptional regulator
MEQNSRLMTLASNVKLFQGIPMHLIGQLIAIADKVEIMEGLTYFNEGDTGDSFYILIIGHVVVEQSKNGKWVQLAALHPGDSFGEMILVDDKVRSARVRATSDSTALYFPLPRLKSSPEILSSLYQNIAKILVKRLKSTNNVVLELHQKAKDAARGALPPPSPEFVEAMKKADASGDFVSYEKDEGAEAGAELKESKEAKEARESREAKEAKAWPKPKIIPMDELEFDMGSNIDPMLGKKPAPGAAEPAAQAEAEGAAGTDAPAPAKAAAAAVDSSSVAIPELRLGGGKKGLSPY